MNVVRQMSWVLVAGSPPVPHQQMQRSCDASLVRQGSEFATAIGCFSLWSKSEDEFLRSRRSVKLGLYLLLQSSRLSPVQGLHTFDHPMDVPDPSRRQLSFDFYLRPGRRRGWPSGPLREAERG